MAGRIRAFDWTRTPLGPPERWPQSLKTLVGLMLASQHPMFIAWGRGQVWLYNDAFVAIMGDKHPARLGQHALDDVWSEARAVLGPLFDRVFAGEAVQMSDFGLELQRHGRLEEAHFAFSYTPARDESGAVGGLFGVCIETTALVLADRRKDAFLAMLAHELRNPLAPIRQAAQIARSSLANATQLRWCHDVIERQATHMSLLLDDLLDVSRITRGALTLRRQPVALGSVIDAAVETARPLIQKRGHELELERPPEGLYVHADALRLAQVVSNLLANAAKYTDRGGRIRLCIHDEAGTVVISVADSGMGIEPDMLPRLFTLFSQAESALERSEGGLGIGLALVKGIVELHGGSVAATSPGLGQGANFVVTLPGLACEPPTVDAAQPAKQVLPRRVVIADDNLDAAESLKMLLELDGHEVRLASDGEEALAVAGAAPPDLMLIDIGMPKLNGHQVARAIRAEPWGTSIQLVALSGWGQTRDREAAMDAGFDHHMTKPVTHEALRALFT